MDRKGSGDPLQALLSSISDPVCGVDTDHRITTWNKAAADALGYAPAEAKGEPIEELLNLDAEAEERLAGVIDDVEWYTSPRTPDESFTLMVTSARGRRVEAEFTTAGARHGSLLLIVDPKPASAARVDLTNELEIYRKAVEESTDMLVAVDRNQRFVFANQSYCEFHGIDEPVEGKKVSDLLPVSIYQGDVRPRVKPLMGGEILQYETERQGPDGSIHTLDVRYYPIENEAGEYRGVFATLRDITELKTRARSLRKSWETYSDLVEGIPDPIIVYQEDGDIVDANQAASRLLGYAAAELEDRSFGHVAYETGINWIDSRIEADNEPVIFETEYRTRSDETVPVEVAATSVEYFGAEGTLTVARDLSDRREYHHQLEAANARLEEYAAVVTQDLRNPLTVAQGWTDQVSESGNLEELSHVADALDRMAEIIDYTHTIAREGDSMGKQTTVDLATIAHQSFHAVKTGVVTLRNELTCTVEADHGRLSYLFERLFENCIERANDEITITVERLASGTGFYVADDGPRSPLVDQPSRQRSAHLGNCEDSSPNLNVVRRIAKAHGWDFRVREGENDRTRFEFVGVDGCREDAA